MHLQPGFDNPATRLGPSLGLTLAPLIPALIAFNLPPSSTALNQYVACGVWGVVTAWVGLLHLRRRTWPLVAALVACLVGVAAVLLFGELPGTLGLSAAAVLAAAMVVACTSGALGAAPGAPRFFAFFAAGLSGAGLLSALVAMVQVFLPDIADGDVIARSGLPGRAVGNLRQPNHLCSLLLWGVIAAVALLDMRRLALKWSVALVVLMVFAVELSASRTGALGLLLLALWGVLDKRLSRAARWLLILTPVIYGLSYGAMALYGHWTDQAFGAEARIASGDGGGGESPNSRTRIWANALALIAQQPWTGVGFGEFNIAWSLTAFPGRPTAFFDHTHNLPLQLAVELGLPLSGLILALLGVALFRAWRCSGEATGDAGTAARAAFMLVLMIGLHSLFEYPLWYAYFLLPTAFAWGFALGSGRESSPRNADSRPSGSPDDWTMHAGRAIGLLMVVGSLYAVADYLRIASIYSPGADAAPLDERIARGQRSLLFGHHADYAAATSPEPLPGRDLAFRRATHHLLDTRLMMSWAEYLAERGETDKARWLAERLREFRNPASDDFFAACDAADADASPQPFQCDPPQRPYHWREFVQR